MNAIPIFLVSPAPDGGARIASQPLLHFAPGEEIYGQGEKAGQLYRVEFGAVRIYRLLIDGRRQISAFHLPGDVFGFEADGRHHFFADAIGTTALRTVSRSSSEYTTEIMQLALQFLVRTQEHLLVVGRQHAVERVAAFLRDMADRQGGLEQVDLPMSRTDIGDYLGLTIETVSRVLTKLRAQGVIRLLGPRTVEIARPRALAALSD